MLALGGGLVSLLVLGAGLVPLLVLEFLGLELGQDLPAQTMKTIMKYRLSSKVSCFIYT